MNDSFEEEQPQFVSISRKGKGKKNAQGKNLDEKKQSSSEVTDTTKRRASRMDGGEFVKETWDTNRNTEQDDPMLGGGAKKPGLFVPSVKKRDKSDAIFNKGSGMLATKQPTNRNFADLNED